MIEIRRLTSEDLLPFYRMHTIVYNQRKDYSKEENQKIDPLDHPAQWAWGAFENGKFLAGMYEIDFLMRFDGHSVKMSGIGGVGTLPEARKGGLIRRIFEQLLPEAYEKGVIFSNLTPFSHDFYRKFGYEIACPRKNVSISTDDFSSLKPQGEFIPVLPGDDTSLLAEIHSAYIAGLNHGIHRDYWPDNRAWKRFTRDEPCAAGTYLYLWKDETGKARSYIKYQDLLQDGEHNMSVTELAFIDQKGLYGALGIIPGLSAQFKNFRWLMPAFIDPCDFSGDAWSIQQEIRPRDMTRVINVKAALEMMRRPAGEGAYIVEVEDRHIMANNGKYLVEFGPEGSKVSLTGKDAHLRCDMGTFSQLVTGYRSLENALYSRREGLELCGSHETLNRVFTLRPQHVTEYF